MKGLILDIVGTYRKFCMQAWDHYFESVGRPRTVRKNRTTIVTIAFIPILATVKSSSMLVHQRQLFPKWNKLRTMPIFSN